MEAKVIIPPDQLKEAIRELLPELLPEAAPSDGEGLVTLREAAAHLSVTERHLRNLVSAGAVPHYKPGDVLRFKLSELDAWSKVEPRKLKAVG